MHAMSIYDIVLHDNYLVYYTKFMSLVQICTAVKSILFLYCIVWRISVM